MAKKPTLLTVGTGYNSSAAINTSLERLRDSFDNTLSRDGSGPNSMETDLDMNSNDIINAGVVNAGSLVLNGQTVVAGDTLTPITYDTDVKYHYKTVAGLVADTQTYTYFATGDYVLAEGFTYLVAASGATDHHLTNAGGVKFYVTAPLGAISLKAFDPDETGVADCSTKLEAALDLLDEADGGVLYIPAGTYLISATVNVPSYTTVEGAGGVLRLGAAGVTMFQMASTVLGGKLLNLVVENPSAHATGKFVNILGNGCMVSNCRITDMPSSDNGTIRVFGSSSCQFNVISNNSLEDCVGNAICVIGSNAYRNRVEGNNIVRAGGFGVYVAGNSDRNTIAYNKTSDNTLELIGIAVGSDHNIVEGNHAQGCGDNGISITSNYNIVANNHCYSNDLSGIHLYGSFNNCTGNVCLRNDQAESNRAGISVQPAFGGSGQNNLIVGNIIDDDQTSPTQNQGIRILSTSYTAWAAGQSITTGDYRTNGIRIYKASNSGTTGATAPTHTTGSVSDGAVTWEHINFFRTSAATRGNIAMANKIGISVNDPILDQQDPELDPLEVHYGRVKYESGVVRKRTVTEANLTVDEEDHFIGVRSTSAWTITLPTTTNLIVGREIIVTDETGTANVNNITISGNGNNIEGSATKVISTAYGSERLYWSGVQWITF